MKTKYGNHKCRPMKYEDLTARIFKGRFGEYSYRSPLYGYKRAYHYSHQVYIYLTMQLQSGPYLDILYFKNANRLEILEAIKNWKATSRKYKKAVQ